MAISHDQVKALEVELRGWLLEHGLDDGCQWFTPAEFAALPCFREGSLEFGSPCLLVLVMGKRFYDVVWCVSLDHPEVSLFARLRGGFYDIIHRHGCCVDYEDAGTVPGDAMFLKEKYEERTPEEIEADEKRRAQTEADCQALQRQGWRWSEDDRIKRVLMDPDDPDSNIWYDPYTGEELLSPKLAERLRESVQRERIVAE